MPDPGVTAGFAGEAATGMATTGAARTTAAPMGARLLAPIGERERPTEIDGTGGGGCAGATAADAVPAEPRGRAPGILLAGGPAAARLLPPTLGSANIAAALLPRRRLGKRRTEPSRSS